MKKQYIVLPKTKEERKYFYRYLIENNYLELDSFNEEYYINSHFPFVIESNKRFWLCESITCCACAKENKQILSMEDYFRK